MREARQSLLHRLLGDWEPAKPADETEAWRRLSAALDAPAPPRRVPAWGWLAAAGLAGAAAVLLVRAPTADVPAPPAPIVASTPPAPRPLPALPARPAAAPPMVRLEALGGSVQVADGAGPTVASNARIVAAGARISTGKAEARLGLPGGSLALLEPSSSARLARLDPDGVEVELSSGAIFVHAAKLGSGSLAIRTGRFRVIVHGTGFRVARTGGEVDVGLLHGSVEIRGDGAASGFFLAPGQRVRFSDARGPMLGSARPLGESASRAETEEARLLGLPTPVRTESPRRIRPLLPTAPTPTPAFVVDDVARCRAVSNRAPASDPVRLDLTLADDGRVLQAALEQGDADAKLASCVAEAALHWKLAPPPAQLRGATFVYAVPLR